MQTAESEHIPTCHALKQLCEDAEVPTSAQDGEILIQFQALTEEWNKENANKWTNDARGPGAINVDMDMLVYATGSENTEPLAKGVSFQDAAVEQTAAPAYLVTEEEFNGVSHVVRGRCKLAECNALMQLVVSYQVWSMRCCNASA